jgi:hypothetical protein
MNQIFNNSTSSQTQNQEQISQNKGLFSLPPSLMQVVP